MCVVAGCCSGCLWTDLSPGPCVRRVVDGIEDGCGSDQPKFSFRVGRSGPECSSSPSPGPGTGARVPAGLGEVGRAASWPCKPEGLPGSSLLALLPFSTYTAGRGSAVGKTSPCCREAARDAARPPAVSSPAAGSWFSPQLLVCDTAVVRVK